MIEKESIPGGIDKYLDDFCEKIDQRYLIRTDQQLEEHSSQLPKHQKNHNVQNQIPS